MNKFRYLMVGGRVKWLPGFEQTRHCYEDRVYTDDFGNHEIGSELIYTNEEEANKHNAELKISIAEFKTLLIQGLKFYARLHLKKYRRYSVEIKLINFESPYENQDIKFGDFVVIVINTGDRIENHLENFLGKDFLGYSDLGFEDGEIHGMFYIRSKDKQDYENKLEELVRRLKAIKE